MGHEPAQVQGRHLAGDGGDGDGRGSEEEELVDKGQESAQDDAQRPCSEGESRGAWVIGLRYRKLHLLCRCLRILLWPLHTHPPTHMTVNEILPTLVVFTTQISMGYISTHTTFHVLSYARICKVTSLTTVGNKHCEAPRPQALIPSRIGSQEVSSSPKKKKTRKVYAIAARSHELLSIAGG